MLLSCDTLNRRHQTDPYNHYAGRGYLNMGLLLRINLALGAVFICAALVGGYACWTILEANARREVFAEAGLMMNSASAIRAYTATEILPLLQERMKTDFPPQSVPFYAATQNFLRLREHHPGYLYKEATLNPTNPRDRAADWEADIIQRFRNDAHAEEVVGERETAMGKLLFLAQPIRTESECAQCHSKPSVAPPTLLARYGSNNGFGWQDNEIVGAQIVAVPFAEATANADRAFRGFVISLLAVFAAIFAVVNWVLYVLVIRPVRQIARVAEAASLGDPSSEEFPRASAREIQSLIGSFNRMRKSLEKAMRLIGP
jgi:HAMP domain-containing protein